ncbi:hypothetical protein H8711_01810 [Clostridiaceae bacterium NSJ-31]|uniref:Uncharacterized protein n=1 Tax=Ligaoa zhengdingensis TaxID=2763658 RepID=A0A926I2V1_9FIRM|nr:hypothetical protein [Ligaoa zhengdingensis]MBC8545674.1 hypothetical protein [Ligaoa zhengdingensis]
MKTGLSKKQKTTNIYFNEDSPMIEVCTYNTDLKNRLTKYAAQYPSECKLIDDDEMGCMTFEISKGRFGFKLTAPYSEERRKAAGELAKKHAENLKAKEK